MIRTCPPFRPPRRRPCKRQGRPCRCRCPRHNILRRHRLSRLRPTPQNSPHQLPSALTLLPRQSLAPPLRRPLVRESSTPAEERTFSSWRSSITESLTG